MTGPLLPPARSLVSRIVGLALDEDIGRGDLTTTACVPETVMGKAQMRARKKAVLAGGFVITEVYAQVDPDVQVTLHVEDGTALEVGDVIATIEGRAASLLIGERVALNFVQRLSGVATITRQYASALPAGATTRIADTRKTTPGLRAFERYAVRAGGGFNHREDLSSAVLIKDNHVAAAGGVKEAIERARAYAPHTSRIECEVDSLAQLDVALEARADIVMLDNFDDATVAIALERARGRAIIEVSGGITLERIKALGAMGVDVISVGALTHSAPAVDIGLDWSDA
jgi:nicotinate-nucleotide pyrophosphorylase (carboxylating)